jgi:hypothetical protein
MEAQIEAILNTKRRDNETWRDVFVRLEPSGRVDMKAVVNLTALMLDKLEEIDESLGALRDTVGVLDMRTSPKPKPKKTKKKK